jgi:isochorismate hydrolase
MRKAHRYKPKHDKGIGLIMDEDYLERIKDYNIRKAVPIPEKAALLVIDMQSHFRELAQPVLDNVISIINVCRATGVKIFFTRHGHRDPAIQDNMLSTWWGDLIEYGSDHWMLLEELRADQSETIIEKDRYSAFLGTELDNQLRNLNVEDIVICGVTTNCCCETTARDAFMHDFRVFFVADATGARNEELQLASLKNLAYGFAYVVNTKFICQMLQRNFEG